MLHIILYCVNYTEKLKLFMKYILALDIGIASVGWAVLDKECENVIEAGSNIFPEASAADNQLRRDMHGSKRNNRYTCVVIIKSLRGRL